jgi:membrane protein DedA with SNARE-associated domain
VLRACIKSVSDPEFLIRSYGYPMLVAGTMAEGETVMIIGGLLASQGYLDLPLVVLCGFMGALAGDQFFFLLGRRLGMPYILKRRRLRDRMDRVDFYCTRYRNMLMAGFRFIYGFRSLMPFFFGVTRVRAGKFFLLNTIGASLWALAVGLTGYFVGSLARTAIHRVAGFPIAIAAVLMCAVLLVGLLTRHRRKKK